VIALAAIFLGMGIYGLFIGKLGASIIAFFCVILMGYAEKKFAQNEREYLAHPHSAKPIQRVDSLEALDSQESEASGSRF